MAIFAKHLREFTTVLETLTTALVSVLQVISHRLLHGFYLKSDIICHTILELSLSIGLICNKVKTFAFEMKITCMNIS